MCFITQTADGLLAVCVLESEHAGPLSVRLGLGQPGIAASAN